MADTDFYNIVNDKEIMTKQMVFYSTFILVYENFVSTWKQAIFHLYLNCLQQIEENKSEFNCAKSFYYKETKDFQNLLSQNKIIQSRFSKEVIKPNIEIDGIKIKDGMAISHWLMQHSFIEAEDFKVLLQAHNRRCDFAHEIDKSLRQKINDTDLDLLQKLISISEKASANWVLKVTLPSNKSHNLVDFLDRNGNKIPPNQDNIITGTSIFYSLVLQNINDIIYGTSNNA